jgi:hypothetical protein
VFTLAVSIVNMVPKTLSEETYQDSEPNLAVNPANPSVIAASAFTPDPEGSTTLAPIYVSFDGGRTWALRSIVPFCDGITSDITLRFSSSGNRLYVAYLAPALPGADLALARTADMTFTSEMDLISQVESGDQPYVQVKTVETGPDAGKDRAYVGFSNGTASVHYSLDAGVVQPSFRTVALEARGGQDDIGYDEPQVRLAVHETGVVYGVFYSVHVGGDAVDVVVVRDDNWGAGAVPFTDLVDIHDGKPGQRIVSGVAIKGPSFGQEAGEGELSIAVDPNDASIVYIAWADQQPATGYTIHVRRSSDGGQNWPAADELRTIPMAQNPALAVNNEGVLGFLFQEFTQVSASPRWQTHFQYTLGGNQWQDLLLATVPADVPVSTGGTYIGDYVHLMVVDADFYGVFSANNAPDPSNFPTTLSLDLFPNGISYQRNHDFAAKKLFGLDGATSIPISIDPFFFKMDGLHRRIVVEHYKPYELAIDPLALVLRGDVYIRLHLPDPPPIDRFIQELRRELPTMDEDAKDELAHRLGLLSDSARQLAREVEAAAEVSAEARPQNRRRARGQRAAG